MAFLGAGFFVVVFAAAVVVDVNVVVAVYIFSGASRVRAQQRDGRRSLEAPALLPPPTTATTVAEAGER